MKKIVSIFAAVLVTLSLSTAVFASDAPVDNNTEPHDCTSHSETGETYTYEYDGYTIESTCADLTEADLQETIKNYRSSMLLRGTWNIKINHRHSFMGPYLQRHDRTDTIVSGSNRGTISYYRCGHAGNCPYLATYTQWN